MAKCPDGHALQPFVTPGGPCDGCSEFCSDGTRVRDCRECDWYLCGSCLPTDPALMNFDMFTTAILQMLRLYADDGSEVCETVHRERFRV